MRYALLVRHDENAAISAEERAWRAAGMAVAIAGLRANGSPFGGHRLGPSSTAATVRCWDGGDVVVSRGPFAGKEQLTAFFVVDCPDVEAAIQAATRIPAAWYGSVEVREVLDDAPDGRRQHDLEFTAAV